MYAGRRGEVEAVAGIDLSVPSGTIFGFLGPNGAGKTTTLRMLATLLPPTDGDAQVAGFDLRRQPEQVRRNIGYFGQQGGTDRSLSGFGVSLRLPGVLVAMAMLGFIALLMASVSYAFALLIRDENTFGAIVFSATLPLLLLSGVLLPMSLAPNWLQDVAHLNLLSYAVDAQRALFANHLADPSVTKGFVALGSLSVEAAAWAARSFGRAVA